MYNPIYYSFHLLAVNKVFRLFLCPKGLMAIGYHGIPRITDAKNNDTCINSST